MKKLLTALAASMMFATIAVAGVNNKVYSGRGDAGYATYTQDRAAYAVAGVNNKVYSGRGDAGYATYTQDRAAYAVE